MSKAAAKPVAMHSRPVYTFPSAALARTWEPASSMELRILDEVMLPTLKRYAHYFLGLGPLPTREHDKVLCRNLSALRHWLQDVLTTPVRPTQIMTPAMLAYAVVHHLTSEETDALTREMNPVSCVSEERAEQATLLGA